jgi:hypothetical protein
LKKFRLNVPCKELGRVNMQPIRMLLEGGLSSGDWFKLSDSHNRDDLYRGYVNVRVDVSDATAAYQDVRQAEVNLDKQVSGLGDQGLTPRSAADQTEILRDTLEVVKREQVGKAKAVDVAFVPGSLRVVVKSLVCRRNDSSAAAAAAAAATPPHSPSKSASPKAGADPGAAADFAGDVVLKVEFFRDGAIPLSGYEDPDFSHESAPFSLTFSNEGAIQTSESRFEELASEVEVREPPGSRF